MLASSQARSSQQADAIIHAKWLIPMTENELVLTDHCLVIQQHLIREIMPSSEVANHYHSDNEFRLDQHVLIPGLINAHSHAAMSLLRGYADDLPLETWLEKYIWPAESRWVSEEFVQNGAELAIAEMLLGGVTAFTDMYYFPDQTAKAALKAGIRVQLAAPVLDFPTVWAQDADEYIHKATALFDQYKNNSFVNVAFGPHATYTVSDGPLRTIATLANELDIPVHMHVHETAQEVEQAVAATGKRPLERLLDLGLVSSNLQCVHVTQLNDEDIVMLARNDAMAIHCPASNLKLASGFCRTSDLLDAGVGVALGTDGAGSNNELNILAEMRLAALIGKGVTGDPSVLSAWQVLHMATQAGANAMGLGDKTGSLSVGKYADVVAIDLSAANSQPVYDPVSTLIYSSQARQVSHVWINGKLNVRDGRLLSLDMKQLLNKARIWGEKIRHGKRQG